MPASSSRRRASGRSKRDADEIEEADPSQNMVQDDEVDGGADDDEEEEAPRRSKGKTVKAEKTSSIKRFAKDSGTVVRQGGDEGDGDDDDDDAPIDVENFRDCPVDAAEAHKLKGVAEDWAMYRKKLHPPAYTLLREVSASTAEVIDGEEADNAIAELEVIMRNMVDVEEELILHEKVINDMQQAIATGTPIEDLITHYEKGVKAQMNDYRRKTSRQKYAKKKEYYDYKQAIWEVKHPSEGMPPVSEFIPKEEGDVSDDDDELEVGGMTQDYKCPLTLALLTDPYTSTKCGHHYSGEAIKGYLKEGHNKCPTAGCSQKLSSSDVKPDKVLEKKMKAVERRMRRQAEEEDDEGEVIE